MFFQKDHQLNVTNNRWFHLTVEVAFNVQLIQELKMITQCVQLINVMKTPLLMRMEHAENVTLNQDMDQMQQWEFVPQDYLKNLNGKVHAQRIDKLWVTMVKPVLPAQLVQDHRTKELYVQPIFAFQIKSQPIWELALIALRVKCQTRIIKVFARISQ